MLLVPDSTDAICEHEKNGLIDRAGGLETLDDHFDRVHGDRTLLARLRATSLETAGELTWVSAARSMLAAYHEIIDRCDVSQSS